MNFGTADAQTTVDYDRRTFDHLRPLDSVLVCLQEAECAWCKGILRLLLRHLHEYVPVFEEDRNS